MKKEEIKEILDNFKNNYDELGSCYYPEDILGPEDLKLLYDYITNLQTIEQQYSAILSENAELDKYKEVLDKIRKYIKGTQIYGMRSGKTLLQKYMNDILELLEEIE